MADNTATDGPRSARLRTLGAVALATANPEASARILAQPKRLAVLTFLAARPPGERISRDRLLATFWPELPGAQARGALRNTLYFLRTALGAEAIPGRDAAVGVAPALVGCDAADLLARDPGHSAETLLALYRGEFLDGVHVSDAPDFERWVDGVRAALRARATELAWRLSEEAEADGHWITAAGYARRAAELAVDVEGASQRLIRLLDRAGDRAAALAEYERLRAWLRSEFGVPPSPETVLLVDGVRGRSTAHEGSPSPDSGKATSGPAPVRSLAVLPFDDLTGDAGVLAAGLAEDLITALATLRGVRVVSRTSAMRFAAGHPASLEEARHVLRVDLVLTGTVRVSAGRVRVAVQLVDAASNGYLWAETYDGTLTDVFEVQSDVALRIARSLELQLSPRQHQRLRQAPTRDLEAYQRYMQGREVWSHRKPGDAFRAIELFERALALDPDFVLARVGLADAHLVRALAGRDGVPGPAREAARAIEKALADDPSSGEAHATLGLKLGFIDWDLEGSARELTRATELSPGYATAHQWRGQQLAAMGRVQEGLAELETALALDLLSPAVNEGKALALYHAGRLEDAIHLFHRTLELDPAYWRAALGLAHCHAARDDLHEATRWMLRAWAGGAAGGNREEAREAEVRLDAGVLPALEYLAALARPRAARTSATRCVQVQLLVMSGREEAALDCLEAAREERSLGFIIVHAPAVDPLAGHVRFRTLMEAAGLLLPRWRRRG